MAKNTTQADKSTDAKAGQSISAPKPFDAVENWLVSVNKQLPQIPKKGRDVIAQLAPWLALAGGIVSILSLLWFWRAGHTVNRIIDISNDIIRTYGGTTIDTSPSLGVTWYLALVLMAVQAFLLLAAFPKLKDSKKAGWNLLFYNALLAALIGIVYLVTPGYGFGSLFGSFIGTAIGLYLLFQVRDHFITK